MARPDAVLFNGGFFTPALARSQVLERSRPGSGPGRGSSRTRTPRRGGARRGVLRQAAPGSRRRAAAADSRRQRAFVLHRRRGRGRTPDARVCVIPKGTEEGTRFELDREFTVLSNQPAAFTLYSSIDRADPVGARHRRRRRPGSAASRAARDRLPLRQAVAPGAAWRCGSPPPSPRRARWSSGAAPTTPAIAGGSRSTCAASKPIRSTPSREAAGDDGAVIVEDEAVERSRQLLGAVFGQGSSL